MPDAPERYYTIPLNNEKPLLPPPPKSSNHITRVEDSAGRKFVRMINIHRYYTMFSSRFRNAGRRRRKHNPTRSNNGLLGTFYEQPALYLPSKIRIFISGHILMYQSLRETRIGIAF